LAGLAVALAAVAGGSQQHRLGAGFRAKARSPNPGDAPDKPGNEIVFGDGLEKCPNSNFARRGSKRWGA
jgi:hypothetical protein